MTSKLGDTAALDHTPPTTSALPTRTDAAQPPAISVRQLTKRFGTTVALDGCSLDIAPGEFVSLLGPSGCGKTTLLRLIGGFLRPDDGSIELLGASVDGLPPNKRPVNTVFQGYALFPHRTVAQNVAFPLEVARVPAKERKERVREALDLVRLPDIGDRSPAQLSGGQSQRVALARAIVGRPGVLLLDEPLAALDLKLRKSMQLELRRIHAQLETTFLYVTHDQEEALSMSDRVVLMSGGRIVQDGSPEEIYDRPTSVFASSFIGEANLLEGSVTAAGGPTTAVTCAGLSLAGPPSEHALGTRVTVSVRPESIDVHPIGGGVGRTNRFPATVRRAIFLGPFVRAVLELSPDVTVTAALPRALAADVAENGRVEVSFSADAIRMLPAE